MKSVESGLQVNRLIAMLTCLPINITIQDCVVQWLEKSPLCPFGRYAMPRGVVGIRDVYVLGFTKDLRSTCFIRSVPNSVHELCRKSSAPS